jgi:TolB protein
MVVPATPVRAGSSVGTLVFSSVFGASRSDTGLYTMPAGGGAETKFAGTEGAYRPRWAPDGSGLAYIHARSIRWIDANGSNDHLLLGHAALPAHHANLTTIAWSPDGTQLLLPLYTSRYRHVRLFRVVLANKRFHLVLKGASEADWSTTGRIAAVKGSGVLTMDPDGSNRTEIYGHPSRWLRWSPDSSMLVFQRNVKYSNRRYSGDIFVMGADGSNPTNLTNSKAYDWSPSWSPDSTRIVWSRGPTVQDRANLFVMDAGGSNRTRLTSTPDLDEYEPDWKA